VKGSGDLEMSATIPSRTLTEEVADFLARGPSPQEMAQFRISDQAQQRVQALMEKNADGTLTPAETAELDEITVLDQLFTLIRARTIGANSSSAHDGSGA
jgi:hypothetical protein